MVYGDAPQDNPYAAPQEDIAPLSDVGPTKAYGYAGFWIRVVAHIIDNILMFVVVGIPMNILQFVVIGLPPVAAPGEPAPPPNPAALGVLLFSVVVSILASVGYYAGMESSKYQATLGKMALGLKVVDLNGRRISFARATGRLFSKFLSALICYIGFIMVAFTEKKQGLHDMIAGTLVIKTRP
ncbi:MAG: RDD family protein [Isosphaeraceae bacterium]|nr:RDD family protein [Isosphaeraceae bacterium]